MTVQIAGPAGRITRDGGRAGDVPSRRRRGPEGRAMGGDDDSGVTIREMNRTVSAVMAGLCLALIMTLIGSDKLATWQARWALGLAAFGLPCACIFFMEFMLATKARAVAIWASPSVGWSFLYLAGWFAPVGALILALWAVAGWAALAFLVACVLGLVQAYAARDTGKPPAPPR